MCCKNKRPARNQSTHGTPELSGEDRMNAVRAGGESPMKAGRENSASTGLR